MSCGEQPFVLSLLPVERVDPAAVEPRVERGPQLGLAPEAVGERDLVDVDVEPAPELSQRADAMTSGCSHGPRAGRNGYHTYDRKKPSIMHVIAV